MTQRDAFLLFWFCVALLGFILIAAAYGSFNGMTLLP